MSPPFLELDDLGHEALHRSLLVRHRARLPIGCVLLVLHNLVRLHTQVHGFPDTRTPMRRSPTPPGRAAPVSLIPRGFLVVYGPASDKSRPAVKVAPGPTEKPFARITLVAARNVTSPGASIRNAGPAVRVPHDV